MVVVTSKSYEKESNVPMNNIGNRPVRVSVIIAAYGQEMYIKEAVESLQNQTFQDWEAIIVDDGSPDNVLAIASTMSEADPRIKVFHTENKGVSAARNFAADKSRGEYLLPLDGDDTIEPEYVGRCVELLDSDPDVDAVYCQWRCFGMDVKVPDVRYLDYESLLLANSIFVTAMIRRKRFIEVGGFDETMRKGLEDWEFWIRYLDESSKVCQLPERLFNYRQKPVSRNSEAHRGTGPFDMQMYILGKHKMVYDSHFGPPITAMGSFKDARKYKRKYEKVFYRRLWKFLKGLLPGN